MLNMEAKRRKLDDEKNENWKFVAVVHEKLRNARVDKLDVWIGKIGNKKLISNLVKDLNEVNPIPDLKHLKRVRNSEILICKRSENVDNIIAKLSAGSLTEKKIIPVPAEAPMTREQYNYANDLWPCNFFHNTELEELLSGSFVGDDYLCHRWWISTVKRISEKKNIPVALVAQGDCLLAISIDNRSEHPLQHSCMLAIDLVARTQGGGVYTPLESSYFNPSAPRTSDTYLCTDCCIYLSQESCTMCSMALVHSRVKAVFYINDVPDRGALKSVASIHQIKSLNHHYRVYKCFPPNKNTS